MAAYLMKRNAPTVIITRPKAAAARLEAELRIAVGDRAGIIQSPVFAYVSVPFEMPDGEYSYIFTSSEAVKYADISKGRLAYCVGAKTAERAESAGFTPLTANGNAQDLIRLILTDDPQTPLVHLRGEASRGDIAGTLRQNDMHCEERIVYRKRELPLSESARKTLDGNEITLLPLFSPETARIVVQQGPYRAPLICVCMSEAVAEEAKVLTPRRLVIAQAPTQREMVASIAALIA